MGRRRISLFRLFIVLTLSVVCLTAQVFAEDAEAQIDSKETTAPAVTTAEEESKAEIVTAKEETKVEEAQVDLQKQEEKEKAPEGVELKIESVHTFNNNRQLIHVKLVDEQMQKVRFADPKIRETLFKVQTDQTIGGKIYTWDRKVEAAAINNGFLEIPVSGRTDYLLHTIRIQYIGAGKASALMIGDQPVKNMEHPIELKIDQKDFVSSVTLEKAVAAAKKSLRELIITSTGDLSELSTPYPVEHAVKGFSIQLDSKKSEDLSVKKLVIAKGNEIKLELSRDVIYGEKFSVIYDPAEVDIDDYRIRDKTDHRKYVEGKTLSVENLAEPIIINISNFRIDPIKKGQEGKATITLSSFSPVDFSKFDIEQDEVKLKGATLVSIEKNDDNRFTLTFNNVTVKNGELISVTIDKLGYLFEGILAQKIEIIEDKEPGQPKPAPNPDLNPKPAPNPGKDQEPKKPEGNNAPNPGGVSARSSVRPDSATSTTIKEDVTPKVESPENKNADSKITLKIGSKEYQVMENGKPITKMMDVAPKVHKGATLLPARMIADILGVNIKYDAATKKVSFSYNEGNEAQLTLGEKFIMLNGERMDLASETLIESGRVLLPLGDVQKAFSKIGLEAKIEWNADSKTVTIEK